MQNSFVHDRAKDFPCKAKCINKSFTTTFPLQQDTNTIPPTAQDHLFLTCKELWPLTLRDMLVSTDFKQIKLTNHACETVPI